MDAYRFLRRLDFAVHVLAANVAELQRFLARITSDEVAPTVFRYRARDSHEQAFLGFSRVLHNVLSAASALCDIVEAQLKTRERKEPRWSAIRPHVETLRSAPETALMRAVRNHALHVDTLDAGFTRTFHGDKDTWVMHVSKEQIRPRDLSAAARSTFDSWPNDLTVDSFVGPFLELAGQIQGQLIASVRTEFAVELAELLSVQASLVERFPGYFDRASER